MWSMIVPLSHVGFVTIVSGHVVAVASSSKCLPFWTNPH